MNKLIIFILSILPIFVSCTRAPVTKPELALERVSWWRAGLKTDDLGFKGLSEAARQSLEYYRKLSSDTVLRFGQERRNAADMITALERFLAITEDQALNPERKINRIKDEFALFRSVGSNGWGKVLFTGYYEPVIACRRAQDETFIFPLYKRPDDIIEVDLSQFGEGFSKDRIFGRLSGKKVIPYFTRQEIDHEKALGGRGLEILWCSDLVDIYMLQVQGSGKADLGNGEIISILYDGQNGRPYRSIGKHLIEMQAISKEKMSAPAIRDYLRSHTEELFSILSQNPSYVFFRIDEGASVGNIGVPLVPGRSIATDARLFPKGALALIRTEKPVIAADGSISDWETFTRFVLNQDTGGAIRGAGRADLFWGLGKEAEIAAGYMKQEGSLYFLLRKQ